MSIQSEITRISGNVSDALSAIADKGVSVPSGANSDDLATLIGQVETGIDTSDATAAAGDILSGKTAYVDGEKITGTIASKTSSNLSASGATVSVPAGYYASTASKSVSTATQATPSITVSTAGLITASATQSAGYVSAGTKSSTKQLTTQAAKTVTPSTSEQTAVTSGVYTTDAVKVAGDANLIAENIKKGVSIFGVAGALESVSFPYSKVEFVSITPTGYESWLEIQHTLNENQIYAFLTLHDPESVKTFTQRAAVSGVLTRAPLFHIENNNYSIDMYVTFDGSEFDTYLSSDAMVNQNGFYVGCTLAPVTYDIMIVAY